MLDLRKSLINGALNKMLKRLHHPLEVLLTCVCWQVAYRLSLRHGEEVMQARGVLLDHSTLLRRAIKVLPVLATVFRKRKRVVGASWRMDGIYIKVQVRGIASAGTVHRAGDAVDFVLTAMRGKAAVWRFLERAIDLHGVPEKIAIAKTSTPAR